MAYEKQTWACGETITAEKMNHIENGIEEFCGGGSPLVVEMTDGEDGIEADITGKDAFDAYVSGTPMFFRLAITQSGVAIYDSYSQAVAVDRTRVQGEEVLAGEYSYSVLVMGSQPLELIAETNATKLHTS